MSNWMEQQQEMRSKARELLEKGDAKVVLGWAAGSGGATVPLFACKPEQCDNLVWNSRCLNNLAVYLTRKEIRVLGKPALIAKGCDIRSAVVLIQESQIVREDVLIIGMHCDGMDMARCRCCSVKSPPFCDVKIGKETAPVVLAEPDAELDGILKMTVEERREFWKREFERCIRCYACRAACPLCYCTRCIVEKNQQQWIGPAQDAAGNLSWNITRAMHLAGRCVGCGACARACPMRIRIDLINSRLAGVVKDKLGYEPGLDAQAPMPMAGFSLSDKADFIK